MKTALIIGVDGQDGSYLAELLLNKGYRVTGLIPVQVKINEPNIQGFRDQIEITRGNLQDLDSLVQCIKSAAPDEIYNLASPSSPTASWTESVQVGDIAGLGVNRILEAIRQSRPQARFFQASSSEMFGIPEETPQDEKTPFHPRNPYGVAKLYGHWITANYRDYYGLYAVSGILFNHESLRRGLNFVTRKVTNGAVRIKLGLLDKLTLGNLDASRDWGYAGDYVDAMWRMLQQDKPEDFVIGSGETHSVREFCEITFDLLGLDYREYVVQDENLFRPAEKVQIVANYRKAREVLGWMPGTDFRKIIRIMVEKEWSGF